jgi:CRISPR-associated protein Cas1
MTLTPTTLDESPADLLIDVFGTFLGKRSERLVVRWREPLDRGEGDSAATSAIVKFPAASPVDPRHNQPGVAPRRPVPATTAPLADQAAQGLLDLWAQDAGPHTLQLSSAARLRERLDTLADQASDHAEWRERAIPLCRLRSLTIVGRGITLSSDLIAALIERGIGLSFLSGRGSPVAQLFAPGLGGTVHTRRSQLAAYVSPLGVQLAAAFVMGKLRNQQHQLQYSGKYLKLADPPRFARLQKQIAMLKNLSRKVADCADRKLRLDDVRDQLLGFEGTGARLYWDGVAILLEGRIDFPGRFTRGACDPVNSALNYGYGILYSQVSAAIVNAGLDLFAGFLHVDRSGKPALVLDLVEEFRAPIVDRTVLAIVNQNIPLETNDSGLTPATRRLLADRVFQRLHTHVPYEGKRWTLASVIQQQARHLAVAVRGERSYQPFSCRW